MPFPPGARPLDVAEVRRQFAAGTLGTVGDDAGRDHVEGDAVAPDSDGLYGDAVEHERQSRLTRWQAQRV